MTSQPSDEKLCLVCGKSKAKDQFVNFGGLYARYCTSCRATGKKVVSTAPEPAADHHAPVASMGRDAPRRDMYMPVDQIETMCIACTAVWGATGWTHDSGCPLRRSPIRAPLDRRPGL